MTTIRFNREYLNRRVFSYVTREDEKNHDLSDLRTVYIEVTSDLDGLNKD